MNLLHHSLIGLILATWIGKTTLTLWPISSFSQVRLWIVAGGWVVFVVPLLFSLNQTMRKRLIYASLAISALLIIWIAPAKLIWEATRTISSSPQELLFGLPLIYTKEFLLQNIPLDNAQNLQIFDGIILLPSFLTLGFVGTALLVMFGWISPVSRIRKTIMILMCVFAPFHPLLLVAMIALTFPQKNWHWLTALPSFVMLLLLIPSMFMSTILIQGMIQRSLFRDMSILSRSTLLMRENAAAATKEPDWPWLRLLATRNAVNTAIVLSEQDPSEQDPSEKTLDEEGVINEEQKLHAQATLISTSLDQAKSISNGPLQMQGLLLQLQIYRLLEANPQTQLWYRATLLALIQSNPRFGPAYDLLAESYQTENPKHAEQIRTIKSLTVPDKNGMMVQDSKMLIEPSLQP